MSSVVFTVVCMAAEWVMLVAGLKLHEMLVGAGAVVLSVIFIWRVLRINPEPLDLRWRDILTLWRLPGMVIQDAWTVIAILMKDLFWNRPADSVYRVTGFRTAKHDPLLVARRVLATLYTTCTPNSIVIGIDAEQSRMLAHQLKLTLPSTIERELGRQG